MLKISSDSRHACLVSGFNGNVSVCVSLEAKDLRQFIWGVILGNWSRKQNVPGKEKMPIYRYNIEVAPVGNRNSIPPLNTLWNASHNALSKNIRLGHVSTDPNPYWLRGIPEMLTPSHSGYACPWAEQVLSALEKTSQQKSEEICVIGLTRSASNMIWAHKELFTTAATKIRGQRKYDTEHQKHLLHPPRHHSDPLMPTLSPLWTFWRRLYNL